MADGAPIVERAAPAPGMARRWRHWYLRALPAYWLFLFVMTHIPNPDLPGPRNSDKWAHVGSYAALAFLYWRFAEAVRQAPLSPRFVWRAAAVLLAFAALDELTQGMVGRGSDPLDWVADAGGVVMVLAALEVRRRAVGHGTWSARSAQAPGAGP